MTSKEKRIEKWQWWLLVAWLLFIAVVGFIVLFRLSSIRTAAPPPLPAASTEFKLGDGPEIEIRGRVLMPDGSPVPEGTNILVRNIRHENSSLAFPRTDKDGNYTATVNVGAKVTAVVYHDDPDDDPSTYGLAASRGRRGEKRIGEAILLAFSRLSRPDSVSGLAFPTVATDVTDPPSPGQYDIQAVTKPIRVYGRLLHPDGTTAAAGRSVTAQFHPFGRAPVLLERDAAGTVREEPVQVPLFTETRDGGVYEFLLTPGEYTLETDEGLNMILTVNPELSLAAGDADREIDFLRVRPSSRFRFTLPDGTELEPKDVRVNVYSGYEHGTNDIGRLVALREADGSAGFLLSTAGTQFVVTTRDGRFGAVRTFHGVESVAPMTLTLQPPARARVRVLNLSSGRPVPGFQVGFRSRLNWQDNRRNSHAVGEDQGNRAMTDSSGIAILEPLYLGGEYHLSPDSGNPMHRPVVRPVEAGETIDIGDWSIFGDFTDLKSGNVRRPEPPVRGSPRRKTEKDDATENNENNVTETPSPEEP